MQQKIQRIIYSLFLAAFVGTNLYQYLCREGDLSRAMQNSEILRKLSMENPEDYRSYSEIHQVLKALDEFANK